MHISEFTGKTEKTLEYLVKPLSVGKDTFSEGYISLENVYKAAEILNGFSKKLDEYDLWKNYMALCTSGVREAANRYFFIDHIKINTGIELKILEPSDEIYIKYLGVKYAMPEIDNYEENGLLFTNISSGNIFINILKKKKLILSEALPYGSLRLTQIFKDIPVQKQHKAYEQDIGKMVFTLKNLLPKKMNIKNMVSSGSSIAVLTDTLKPQKDIITKKDLVSAYNKIKEMNVHEIIDRFKLRQSQIEILIPTLITYLKIMDFAGVGFFYFSRNTFPYSMSLYYSKTIKDPRLYNRFKNTLYYIGEKYSFDKNHAKIVVKFALKIFNKLKKIHSLKWKDRHLLESACILHDIGYIIEPKYHEKHSYNIIKSIEFPGYSKEFIEMMAVISFLHKEKHDINKDEVSLKLPIEKRLIVYKLSSILRIADALDASHNQLISDLDIKIESNAVHIKANAKKYPYLEHLSFNNKSEMFTRTFGADITLETNSDFK
ncbi:MAG: HD domain-containing protein [Candidatus Acididesulfobacter diazotrophicus]|jgi:exopolyphosphatase/guanosine-5'-triphosphate,3'-diphosphate pyrophosphatase|uniref:HD domain-containing protein n=1 Tax=Candidatus Acididesulfobacter diazotrophicus TaxID=2597226 RepID=A0A519BJZ0_9DELT|nr:MAG: HD domain-containing protein [Candidatus Acididesulfobacter diazotrophicus]